MKGNVLQERPGDPCRPLGAAEVGGVLHCFSGDLTMAAECVAMGFYLSIPGTVTYPRNEGLHDVVRGMKIEHLLLETDCPYLAPVPHRGKRNEPAFVVHTAEAIAELKADPEVWYPQYQLDVRPRALQSPGQTGKNGATRGTRAQAFGSGLYGRILPPVVFARP